MQEIARRIATVSTECKIPLIPDEYVQSFKMELMDAVFKWCGGATFSDICKVGLTPSCILWIGMVLIAGLYR
jgi:ATP-dependent RNA helicase DOB1